MISKMWSYAYYLQSSKPLELPREVIEHPQNYRIRMTGFSVNIPQASVNKAIFVYCNIAAKTFSLNGSWTNIVGVIHSLSGRAGITNQRIPTPTPYDLEIIGGLSGGLLIRCNPPLQKGVVYFDIMKKE